MASSFFYMCTLLTISLSFPSISTAVEYRVSNPAANTPGGIRFNKDLGVPFTKKTMGTINKFIWSTVFQQNTPADRKPLDVVNLYIVERSEATGLAWGNNNINVSGLYLKDFNGPGDLKRDFTSLLYHEMTHIFQWNGEGTTPVELVEGIAEYTKIKANYMNPGFVKPGEGNKWDQGYAYTARFLEYCAQISKPGFVAELNKRMRHTYQVKYFQELTGKPVDQLWKEYKAKYSH